MDEHAESQMNEETARVALKRVMSGLYPEPDVSTEITNGIITGVAHYTPELEHTGAPGWVQGGLAATVIDFVSARIAKVALDSSVATGTLDLRYRQPVLIDGGPYKIEGVTEKRFSRTCLLYTSPSPRD